MDHLAEIARERGPLLAELLRRTPSAWAKEVRWITIRKTGRTLPYSFKGRPYLVEVHDDQTPELVIMKGAQTGFTEACINRQAHVVCALRDGALHVLPQLDQIRTFVQARIQPMLDHSPDLARLPRGASNPGHQQIAGSNWYFRGSNSPNTIVEFACRIVVLDELDRLSPEGSELAPARMEGIEDELRRLIKLSTPTHAGRGIDSAFTNSSREHFHLPCLECGEFQALTCGQNQNLEPPDTLDDVINAAWRCKACGIPWSEKDRLAMLGFDDEGQPIGQWVAEIPKHPIRGLHVSQLYSPTMTAKSIAKAHWKAIHSDDRPRLMRHFWNHQLALPWATEGDQVTDADIERVQAIAPFDMREPKDGELVSMGIDVGRQVLHVCLSAWNSSAVSAESRIRTDIAFLKVATWEEAWDLFVRFKVSSCVVDHYPEGRNARDFQKKAPDRIWVAEYPDSPAAPLAQWIGWKRDKKAGPVGLAGGIVKIHRTEAFDRVIGRFKRPATIRLPGDFPEEAADHLKVMVRIIGVDKHGNEVARWDNGTKADHYAHTMVYAELAGLQVVPLSLAEMPEERGDAVAISVPVVDAFSPADEMEALGGELTGIY